ncbi:MAG: DUF3551 domain-containing protein [Pseudolabrys sp.]
MPKLTAALFAAITLAAMLTSAAPARAEVLYPWCALEGGKGGGATNCGFVNRAQCMATISGIGGYCYENPAYPGPGHRPIFIQRGPRPGHG